MLSSEDKFRLKQTFGEHVPDWFLAFLECNDIEGKCISLSETEDASGLGADFQVMNVDDMIDESTRFFPGISAKPNGYIPIATCLNGSGDPYFIKCGQSVNDTPIFRIPHNSVVNNVLDASQIELVYSNIFFLTSRLADC